MKQVVMIELDVPEGFEATGEYRRASETEFWLSEHELPLQGPTTCPWPILRKLPAKVEQPRHTIAEWDAMLAKDARPEIETQFPGGAWAHGEYPVNRAEVQGPGPLPGEVYGWLRGRGATYEHEYKAVLEKASYYVEFTGNTRECKAQAARDADCNRTHANK